MPMEICPCTLPSSRWVLAQVSRLITLGSPHLPDPARWIVLGSLVLCLVAVALIRLLSGERHKGVLLVHLITAASVLLVGLLGAVWARPALLGSVAILVAADLAFKLRALG